MSNSFNLFITKSSGFLNKLCTHDIVSDITKYYKEWSEFVLKKWNNLPDCNTEEGLIKAVQQVSKGSLKEEVSLFNQYNDLLNKKWFQIWYMKLPCNQDFIFGGCAGGGKDYLKGNYLHRSLPMNYLFKRSSIYKWYVLSVNKTFDTGKLMTMSGNGNIKISQNTFKLSEVGMVEGYEKCPIYLIEKSHEINVPLDEVFIYATRYFPKNWDRKLVVDLEKLKMTSPNLANDLYVTV